MRDTELRNSLHDRARRIVADMPMAPFTAVEFLIHATEVCAIERATDIEPMLEFLTDNEVIRRIDGVPGRARQWMLCEQRGIG